MCLTTHLYSKLALMGDHETMALSNVAFAELLLQHGQCTCAPDDDRLSVSDLPTTPMSTTEIALALVKPESTVRRAIARGAFGPSAELKPNGKHYRVPREKVQRVAAALLAGADFEAIGTRAEPVDSTAQNDIARERLYGGSSSKSDESGNCALDIRAAAVAPSSGSERSVAREPRPQRKRRLRNAGVGSPLGDWRTLTRFGGLWISILGHACSDRGQ